MDYLQNLRLQNLFGNYGIPPTTESANPYENLFPVTPITAPTPMPMQAPAPDYDVAARMSQIYQPETEATNHFNSLINAYPKDMGHSKLGRIGAAILGAGTALATDDPIKGYELGSGVLDYKRNKQIADWKNQISPAQQAANLERNNNTNERTLAQQTVQSEINNRRLGETERKNQATEAINKQKADAQTFKSLHPNWVFKQGKNGTLVAYNPTNPNENLDLGKTGLSQIEIEALNEKRDAAKIIEQTKGQIELEGVKQGGRESIQETRGWKTANIPDPSDPSKMIGIKYNEITGETQPIQMGGKNVGPMAGMLSGANAGGQQGSDPKKVLQDKARETIAEIDTLLDEKGNLTSKAATAVGKSRYLGLQYLNATDTKAADVSIKRIKSEMIVNLIAEMKAQSKTGATGFGQLNIRELDVLERAASKLDPTLDEGTFAAELNRIREKLQKILQPTDGLSTTETVKPKLTAAELIKKHGG